MRHCTQSTTTTGDPLTPENLATPVFSPSELLSVAQGKPTTRLSLTMSNEQTMVWDLNQSKRVCFLSSALYQPVNLKLFNYIDLLLVGIMSSPHYFTNMVKYS